MHKKVVGLSSKYTTKIPREKFTKYALNPARQPDKAKVFKKALGFTLENYNILIAAIEQKFDVKQLHFRGANGYGEKFEQIMEINGPNGKTAKVLTGWIRYYGDSYYTMTSAYVTDKKR